MPVSLAAARRIALSFPGAIELPHFDRPSFRVGEGKKYKIFATLWEDDRRMVAMLTPDQQDELVAESPQVFEPVRGSWGLMGATFVHLRFAKASDVRRALSLAWTKAAPKSLTGDVKPSRSRGGASGTSSRRKR